MATVFERAISDTGQAYVDDERQLIAAGAGAVPALQSYLANPDFMVRLISAVLLAWISGHGPRFQAALDYLEYLPRHLEGTPATAPQPDGVAFYLHKHFGGELVDLLALRLLKQPDWPEWRQIAVLFYLRDHAKPSITDPLIRFVVSSPSEHLRRYAVDAIRAAHDTDLPAKLRAEEAKLTAQKRRLPEELRALLVQP